MRSSVKIEDGYIPDTGNLIFELCIHCSLYKKNTKTHTTKQKTGPNKNQKYKFYQASSALKPLGFLIFRNTSKSIKTLCNNHSINNFSYCIIKMFTFTA